MDEPFLIKRLERAQIACTTLVEISASAAATKAAALPELTLLSTLFQNGGWLMHVIRLEAAALPGTRVIFFAAERKKL